MRIRCARHEQFFGYVLMLGEKEPLNDDSITDEMCPACHQWVLLESQTLKIEKETKRLHRAKYLLLNTLPILSELKTQEDVDLCADLFLARAKGQRS